MVVLLLRQTLRPAAHADRSRVPSPPGQYPPAGIAAVMIGFLSLTPERNPRCRKRFRSLTTFAATTLAARSPTPGHNFQS
jgi:hypothetical protein